VLRGNPFLRKVFPPYDPPSQKGFRGIYIVDFLYRDSSSRKETRIHVVFSRRAGEHDLGADDDGFDLFDDGANTVLDLVDDGLKEVHVTSLSLIGF